MISFFQNLFGIAEKRTRRRALRHPRVTLGIERLEDRCVPAIIAVGPTEPFHTIQAGVNAAHPGDTVLVDPGTYTEQVTITTSNITLEGKNEATTIIKAPSAMVSPNAILEVAGAKNVTVEHFTIEGPGTSSSSLQWGVRIDSAGSANIIGNHITDISDTPFGAAQTGVGILVGRAFDHTTGSAFISGNVIDAYQKDGIVVDNIGSSAVISGNVITGVGPTTLIAQNGIQISDGANATVVGNAVSGNEYTPSPQASGILLFNPGTVSVTYNTVTRNDYGIFDQGGVGTQINFNVANNNTLNGILLYLTTGAQVGFNGTDSNGSGNVGDGGIQLFTAAGSFVHNNTSEFNNGDGIFVDNTSGGNYFLLNFLKFNTVYDAEDLSTGGGTSGTADLWTLNVGNTSFPAGLVLSAKTLGARSRWGSSSNAAEILELRILSIRMPHDSMIP
jgi:hypothetical protein